jgi:hypothetical protein
MIGPRRGIAARAAGIGRGGIQASSTRKRSRSRSKSPKKAQGKESGREKGNDKKEFAWMDSGDESDASKKSVKSSASSTAGKAVPLKDVQTLGQMARQAPDLEKRLNNGDVRPRELVEAAAALARSKFFDAGLFKPLHSELARACRKGYLSTADMLAALCDLAELNAYDKHLFEDACSALLQSASDLERMPESERKRLDAALKRVNHDPGQRLMSVLKAKAEVLSDRRAPCPLFFKGQCKWGPKCKLSHDDAAFERSIRDGTWKPPSQTGTKSRGFEQSADLFKQDRCGALW